MNLPQMMKDIETAETVTYTVDRYGYRIDGEFFRRVTTLLGGIPKPWMGGWAAKMVAEFAVTHKDSWWTLPETDAIKLLKGHPWSKRDDAGDRGAAVHNALEAWVRKEPLPEGLTEEEQACAEAAMKFLTERGGQPLATELTVFNRSLGYAGTLDLWERLGDVNWLLDYKTSKDVYVEHAVQQVAYERAEFAIVKKTTLEPGKKWEGKVIPWQRPDRLGIVHVTPEEAKLYTIIDSERLWTVFRAAAHVKAFQLDTDNSFGKTPRVQVFEETT